jgi:hypothetical protein
MFWVPGHYVGDTNRVIYYGATLLAHPLTHNVAREPQLKLVPILVKSTTAIFIPLEMTVK